MPTEIIGHMGNKGQGSFLAGDLPSIIMIVISISFFLSSVFMANSQFDERRKNLDMKAALVDLASIFLKENAEIGSDDMSSSSQFWDLQIKKIESDYGVQIHVKVQALDSNSPSCTSSCEEAVNPDCCAFGSLPPNNAEVLSKRFPVALRTGATGLEVYPALVKVSVYTPQ